MKTLIVLLAIYIAVVNAANLTVVETKTPSNKQLLDYISNIIALISPKPILISDRYTNAELETPMQIQTSMEGLDKVQVRKNSLKVKHHNLENATNYVIINWIADISEITINYDIGVMKNFRITKSYESTMDIKNLEIDIEISQETVPNAYPKLKAITLPKFKELLTPEAMAAMHESEIEELKEDILKSIRSFIDRELKLVRIFVKETE